MIIVRRFARSLVLLACFYALGFVSNANAQRAFRATLDGAQEPVLTTTATGTGTVVLNAAETSISVSISFSRSEERRVGKECNLGCRSRWSPYH